MQRNFFIHADEALSGKTIISFSIIKIMRAIYPKIAFFRPITNYTNDNDNLQISKALNELGIDSSIEHGPCLKKLTSLLSQGQYNEIMNDITNKYQKIKSLHDVIICDGIVLPSNVLSINPNLNLEIANSLNCEIIFVTNANGKTIEEMIDSLVSQCHILKQNNCQVLGIIVNRTLPIQTEFIRENIERLQLPFKIIGIIPEHEVLAKPSIEDISRILDAEIVHGIERKNRLVYNYIIAAKNTNNFLAANHSKNDCLIITPGDREDILLAAILADISTLYPNISGIVLTAGFKPSKIVKQILDGITNCPTIMLSNLSTFDAANILHKAHYATAISSKEKIGIGCNHIIKHLQYNHLTAQMNQSTQPTNRYMLQNHLLNQIKINITHLVFPEGDDLRVISAAVKLRRYNTAIISLIGEKIKITTLAHKHNLNLTDINIIQPNISEFKTKYAQHLYEKRKHKNMTINIAEDMVTDSIMFATCMVDTGDADAMVSGATHTTSDTIRPALQLIKAKPNTPFVCSIFVMCMQNKVIIYGDCALTINPDAKQLAHIAESAANMAKLLKLSPMVALLSYSSGTSGHGASVDKVKEAYSILTKTCPSLAIAGPIQYDAAVDPNVGKRKLPNNPVAGQANVLIFPDLDTGNNTYKAVQKEAKGLAIGPILLGLNKPINDLSRGCNTDEIFMTALITILQSQGE